MRLDAMLVDQPAKHLSRAVSAVAYEPRRIEVEALHRTFNHAFSGEDLGLSDRRSCFDINDDRVLSVDQIVGRVAKEGLPAIEEAIFAGIAVNVTLLFSREQYVAAAEAFLRGIERRIDAGLNPQVGSVASVFVSRWDAAVASKVPENLLNKLGVAIAERTYKAASALLSSARWRRVYNLGGRPQRLLWASTGTKDPKASDILYMKALAAPFTVNTMPEATLKALATHTELGGLLPTDGGNCEEVLVQFAKAGIDVNALAAQLQEEGADSFVKSWNDLMTVISSKSASLDKSARAAG